jgi:nucleoside-diphosphate-sugar epimerase
MIFVTSAAGIVGRSLLRRLVSRGYRVRALRAIEKIFEGEYILSYIEFL